MSDPFERPFFALKEAAEYFRITKMTLYRLAKLKKIPAFKVGGQWRFKKDIEEFLAER